MKVRSLQNHHPQQVKYASIYILVIDFKNIKIILQAVFIPYYVGIDNIYSAIVMSLSYKTNISDIEIIAGNTAALPDYMIKEQNEALQDLLKHNLFQPLNDNHGPYSLVLSIQDNRLLIHIRNAEEEKLNMLVLSLKPYKRLIQDYFLMLDSYEKARLYAGKEKLEAIDMGRRGIHNEGADLFLSRLQDKIEMDHETARKFFTLICVLHKTNLRLVK
jgi:uncharacterized protein (UPF0262 family)